MSLPERLGRLRRIDRIGAGGFATVWLYHDDELDSPVAVKALADNWAQREDVCDRFLEEARILRRADSDHVVRVYDIGAVDGTPYFVMSYADRGTVADLIEPGVPLQADRVVDLLAQAGDGVAVLHRHGVIHRDIKPQNLLIRSTPGGGERVMVADLGVAKAMLHASGLTQVVGTPAYMAPEQAVGIGLDLRADVHALGAVGYHLLTGRFVREGGIGSLAYPTLPLAPSQVAAVPTSYDAVVMRALATNPDDRWPDVPSFVNALRLAQQSADPPAPPTVHVGTPLFAPVAPPPPPSYDDNRTDIRTRDEPRRGGALRLAALALAVLVLAFGVSYGAIRMIGNEEPEAKDPAGQTESPSGDATDDGPTEAPADDIDFPALVVPATSDDYTAHQVRDEDYFWNYLAPEGWEARKFTTNDPIAPEDIDVQRQVVWRPDGEPLAGGYTLRVLAQLGTDTVAQRVEKKAAAFRESPDLDAVDIFKQTSDSLYLTYRDEHNRVRYNFFTWIADGDARGLLEISVSGRKIEQDALSDLLDRVAESATPG